MIIIMSTLATLLMLVAAVTLFVRMRSKATALYLFGMLLTPALPFIGHFLGMGSRANIAAGYAALFFSIGPLCAGIGLLWHALTTPKSVQANAPSQVPPTT
jgi:hypothetical protein